jgi:cold shock CspA family protein/ribosome-associated translation inhibitor RaiA
MQLPLQLTFRNMESSSAVETDVERYIAKLERRFGRIMSCRVAIQAPHRHHRQGKLFRVSVDLKVPGREIAATSAGPKDHAHEDIHVAIRDVFEAVGRRLQDHARKGEGAVKAKEAPAHGKIRKLFPVKGYGFVESADGAEIYFHKNAVANGGFEKLRKGQEVRMVIETGEHGLQASVVKPVGKHHIAAR